MKNALQQGHADGMCGLYALLNFFRSKRDHWPDTPQESLKIIFETCNDLGWLTASYLIDGFSDCHLKRIFDVQVENWRIPFASFYISDVVASKGFSDFASLSRTVLEKSGSIIASHDARRHWVLITKRNGEPSVVDSSSSDPVSALSGRLSKYSLDWGLVVLPAKRPSTSVDL